MDLFAKKKGQEIKKINSAVVVVDVVPQSEDDTFHWEAEQDSSVRKTSSSSRSAVFIKFHIQSDWRDFLHHFSRLSPSFINRSGFKAPSTLLPVKLHQFVLTPFKEEAGQTGGDAAR